MGESYDCQHAFDNEPRLFYGHEHDKITSKPFTRRGNMVQHFYPKPIPAYPHAISRGQSIIREIIHSAVKATGTFGEDAAMLECKIIEKMGGSQRLDELARQIDMRE